MIIVKLCGGLGNQMFQYALGFNLALLNNTGLKLDTREYKKYRLHSYALDKFNISAVPATKKEADSIAYKKYGILEKAVLKLMRIEKEKTGAYIKEKSFSFDQGIMAKYDGNIYLDGYWQSPKYFSDADLYLMKEFTLKEAPDKKNSETLKKITDCESVSLHIRCGDYVSNSKAKALHGVDLNDYYRRAVDLIIQKTNKAHFFIFSDDPAWVKANFKYCREYTVIDINPPEKGYNDIRLISACRHNIIANSSFSWWGAWLNRNENKTVTAPSRWFNDKQIDTKDVYCEKWTIL